MRQGLRIGLGIGLLITLVGAMATGISTAGSAPTSVTLVGTGSTWRYLDNGSNQGTAWRATGFVDSAWKSGPAQLGYGDGDEATVVSFGPNAATKYRTTYFRRAFTVADASQVSSATLQLLRDDGAVAYLNGVEVVRSNMPTGTITSTTYASTAITGTAERAFTAFSIPAARLTTGTNVLAVEIHQDSNADPDVSFDAALTAIVDDSSTTSSSSTSTTSSSTTSTSTSTSTSTTSTSTSSTSTTTTTTAPPAGNVVLAVGDLAKCPSGHQADVAKLLAANPGLFLPLGDLAYPNGTFADYSNCYDPTFAPFKAASRPTPGNHEYDTGTAAAYLAYFGSLATPNGKTWYSLNIGSWHFVSLDSDCSKVGGCGVSSAQYKWLASDLASTTTPCVAAFWHHAPWSSTPGYDEADRMLDVLKLLQQRGTDFILTGHMHSYERFARMTALGQPSPTGFRNFVVGTGGEGFFSLGPPVTGSEARNASTFGVLRLDLSAQGYTWHFLPVAGSSFTDSGSDTC